MKPDQSAASPQNGFWRGLILDANSQACFYKAMLTKAKGNNDRARAMLEGGATPVVNTNAKDPFLILLRRETRTHFISCVVAFLALAASRYVGLRAASSDAVLLAPSTIGFIADFATAVLMLTFFRVLYGIPLWFVRPAIRRVGVYVMFTLVFGALFTMRTQQALGASVEPGGVRFYYPFPSAAVFVPLGELSRPRLRETSRVSIVEYPDTSYRFVPAFQFDAAGQARLRLLYQALTTVTNRAASKQDSP